VWIDAAINAGNSGGPVLLDGKLVGIAFQSLEEAQNVGYAISAPAVKHVLRDVESPPYDGFPGLGLRSWAERRASGGRRSEPASGASAPFDRAVDRGSSRRDGRRDRAAAGP